VFDNILPFIAQRKRQARLKRGLPLYMEKMLTTNQMSLNNNSVDEIDGRKVKTGQKISGWFPKQMNHIKGETGERLK